MKRQARFLAVYLIASFAMAGPILAAMVSRKGIGEQKVLVVMARFPDVEPSFSPAAMREKYFNKLDGYVRSVSYGKAWIAGKMTPWYTLPHPVAHYRISQHNLGVDKDKVTELIQDAIALADRDEDVSQYPLVFISLGAQRGDYGMMGLCGYPGMLGWQSQLPLKSKIRGKVIPGGVAIYCESAHVGVVFHDMAHIMGGVQGGARVLPCLYDHDLQARPGPFRGYAQFYLVNVGYFDPMSCHYYGLKQGPPGVCAWTKLRLGWIDSQKLVEIPRGGSRTVRLGPLGAKDSDVQVVKLPLDAFRYYLIENRQPIGPDRNLPAHGVLVYYCDDTVGECRRGNSPIKMINADPSVPELRGGPFTPGGKNEYRDEKRGVSVKIIAQKGNDYEIRATNGGGESGGATR